jgi:hypothetical protein
MSQCTHTGFHSGRGRYAADEARLRYVIVCDECGDELREVASVEYEPEPRLEPVAAVAG